MDYYRVIRQSVELGNGGDKDRGTRGNGDEFPRSYGSEDREEGVSIVSDGLDLS